MPMLFNKHRFALLVALATVSLQQISGIYGAQLEWTPFTGKYSLFGKLFSAYDFYAIIPGIAGINVKPEGTLGRTCDQAAPMDPASPDAHVCGVSGTKLGG